MGYRKHDAIADIFLAQFRQVISCKLILKLVYPSPKNFNILLFTYIPAAA